MSSHEPASDPGPEQASAPRYLGLAPYLYYTDATEALDWLIRVFGFTERVRYTDGAGEVFTATVDAGDAEIQLTDTGPDFFTARGVPGPVGQLTVIYVDDVDAQHRRIRAALGPDADVPEPTDQPYGARLFTMPDIGGNSWTFWQRTDAPTELPPGWHEVRASDG